MVQPCVHTFNVGVNPALILRLKCRVRALRRFSDAGAGGEAIPRQLIRA
jgi:hypothetical protein